MSPQLSYEEMSLIITTKEQEEARGPPGDFLETNEATAYKKLLLGREE